MMIFSCRSMVVDTIWLTIRKLPRNFGFGEAKGTTQGIDVAERVEVN